MSKKEQTLPPVTYVRVREIFHPFVRYKYGDFPVDLPETCRLYDAMATSLVPNYAMRKIAYSCFSQAAFEYDPSITAQPSPGNLYLPSEEDRGKLVPFLMPASVVIGGRVVPTDKWFQLTVSGYKQATAIIESEFWNKFVEFDQKFRLYCCRSGAKYEQGAGMEKFMRLVGMDMRFKETLARYWRGKKAADMKMFSAYSRKEHTDKLREYLEMESIVSDDSCRFG